MTDNTGQDKAPQNKRSELKRLQFEIEALERETAELFNKLDITPEKIQKFLDKSNYSEKEWEFIQKERTKFEEQLERELSNIDDPERKKQAYKELINSASWMKIQALVFLFFTSLDNFQTFLFPCVMMHKQVQKA